MQISSHPLFRRLALSPLAVALLVLLPTCVIDQAAAQEASDSKLRVLIIDGQNNHGAWPKTTRMMESYLKESGRFEVEIERTKFTWKGGKLLEQYPLEDGKAYEDLGQPKSDPDFKPDFAKYDVVVSNFGWKAAPWPEETRQALIDFVDAGGGFVVVHAANNSFGSWKEFNQMIGLGGWDGRNEKSGPYVYIDDGKVVRDDAPGSGGNHGPQHEFQIVTRAPEHPIMKGLPRAWKHTKDELYQKLRGPAENMEILATAYADPKYRGTDRHEPMLLTIDYGKGRIFHTPMGHDDVGFSCVGFITVFLRGCEWAATGEVTLTDIPEDFPKPLEASKRDWTK